MHRERWTTAGTGWRKPNPHRFWLADFRPCLVKALGNTQSITKGFALPEQKSALPKLQAPDSWQFSSDFRLSLMQMGCRPSKRKRRKAPERDAVRRCVFGFRQPRLHLRKGGEAHATYHNFNVRKTNVPVYRKKQKPPLGQVTVS